MRIVVMFFIFLFIANASASPVLSNKSSESVMPSDFRATCERQDDKSQSVHFIWDLEDNEMLISGNATYEDGGWLKVGSTEIHETELYTSYQAPRDSGLVNKPLVHRWKMSFWYGKKQKPGRHVRAFQFTVNKDLKGAASEVSFFEENKVISPRGDVFFANCVFNNIPY